MPDDAQSGLVIRLFGPFEARKGGQLLTGLQTREGERLVALLVLNHGHLVAGPTLASTLWPETGSLDSLRHSVNHVRQVLGDEAHRLQSSKGGILLDLEGADADLIRFDAAAAGTDRGSLEQAIALYRGPLLYGWEDRHGEDKSWVIRAREKRRDRNRQALKSLARICMAQAEYEAAVLYLQQYVAGNPSEEWAWVEWMKALVSNGERITAMSLYQKSRDLFHQKYHITPPAEMVQMYHSIQQGTAPPFLVPEDNAKLEPIGGSVPLQSPYYVVRPTDAEFQSAIARRDSIVLVKGPRQTGKTSLLARGMQYARRNGAVVLITDLQKLSASHWADAERFFRALAQTLADQLNLDTLPEHTWSSSRGANENFERYLRREILQKTPAPIVWGLDEVDRLLTCPFGSDVFSLFRAWHNERSLDPGGCWHQLTLAIAYATEAHLFITNLDQSPFNVGTRLIVEDFTLAQVKELNDRYAKEQGLPEPPLANSEDVTRFFLLVGGNPYLVRRGLHELVIRAITFAEFQAQADKKEGCYTDHLQRLTLALARDAELRGAVRDLLRGGALLSPANFYRLRSAGVVQGNAPEAAQFRCRLYKSYLGVHLK